MNLFIGIDPGKSGAIMAVDGSGHFYSGVKCSSTERDLWNYLKSISRLDCFCYIEKVHAMRRGPKGATQGVSSSFKFGQSYGFLRGILVASEIPFEDVTPVRWQRRVGITAGPKGETGIEKKNRHKGRAQELFPGLKITHSTADAVLIADYCRRVRRDQ